MNDNDGVRYVDQMYRLTSFPMAIHLDCAIDMIISPDHMQWRKLGHSQALARAC